MGVGHSMAADTALLKQQHERYCELHDLQCKADAERRAAAKVVPITEKKGKKNA